MPSGTPTPSQFSRLTRASRCSAGTIVSDCWRCFRAWKVSTATGIGPAGRLAERAVLVHARAALVVQRAGQSPRAVRAVSVCASGIT